jgi:Domain of unknown function (DUF5658)
MFQEGSQVHELQFDRRSGVERRRTTLAAYWHGAMRPRRRAGRRASDQPYAIIDSYSPRVLVLVLAILGLCVLDGVLTIILMAHGASELNPVLALFLPHSVGWFAAVKLSLTSACLCVLAACSRMTLFRAVRGELLLYVLAAGYAALIVYQLCLLSLATSETA